MKILSINPEPLVEIPAYTTAPGGRGVLQFEVPVIECICDGIPLDLDGLLVTGDLQGIDDIASPVEHRRLIGHIVAEELAELGECDILPRPERTGVIIAGDMYAVPTVDKRGGLGEVTEVWQSFANRFRWVTGVGGNHDLFRGKAEFGATFNSRANIEGLDGDVVELDGLSIAGISGVIGRSDKPWRRSIDDFEAALVKLLRKKPDILITHLSPSIESMGFRGEAFYESFLERQKRSLLVCAGHVRWPKPFHTLNEVGILNAEARVLLLRPDR